MPHQHRGAWTTPTQRSILFIAYHYPPIRSAGVERTLKFQRYLPENGYRAQILTTRAFGSCAGPEDPAEAGIIRAWEPVGWYRRLIHRHPAATPPPSYVRAHAGRLRPVKTVLTRHVLIPDGQITWIPHALVLALRALRRIPVVALYSTYPPASAHLLGLLLKRLTGLPWLADYRDAWTYDPLDPVLTEAPHRLDLERRMEHRVVDAADVVVAATRVSADHLRSAYPHRCDHIHVIPNGFDPQDLGSMRPADPAPAAAPLRLVHTGAFAASHPQRSPEPLLAALRTLADHHPSWTRRLKLTLVGHLTDAEIAGTVDLQRVGMVEVMGHVPRDRALELQNSADLLILVDHARPWPASNVPGKFYEYLAMGRPILAICGPGMVDDLVTQLRAGVCVRPEAPETIAVKLARLYHDLRRGRGPEVVDPEALRPFHRRAQAASLAQLFDMLIDAPERSW